MMNIRRYTIHDKNEWDELTDNARNATFLFRRQYMDYHSDRFADHSLLLYNSKGKLIAALPANEIVTADGTRTLISHQGLTYGGLIMSNSMHAKETEQAIMLIMQYMKNNGFTTLRYKPLPYIYHSQPSDDDLFFLWKLGAKQTACGLSTTINLRQPFVQNKRKLTYYNKLQNSGYIVNYDTPLDDFWPLLEENLMTTHNVMPVHSLSEIKLLKERFTDHIRCVTAVSPEGTVIAGTVLYITPHVIHTQYLSASETGKQCHAMDFLILSLVKKLQEQTTYDFLDFGISTEQGGELFNDSLCAQKEAYGGRTTLYTELTVSI